MRLIDADALKEKFIDANAQGINLAIDRYALKCINDAPTIEPEIIRCEECRWGREACGNIECFVDINVPPEYHGYEWFCPNGERRTDE